jgi:1-acyl-sn-glycerol-3-phosphate acyltransferase
MSSRYNQLSMSPVYGICHFLVGQIHGTFFRGEVVGMENIPSTGPFVLASNHASHLDPFLVGGHVSRQVSFFARKTLWKPGFASWWLNAVGTIPVDRDGGSDITAIKRVLQALEAGKVLIMFPEGTRSPDGALQPAKPGVGMFACRTQVPVVPARIFGSYEAFGRDGRLRLGTRVSVVYGKPLGPTDYDDPRAGKERYLRASERIMAAISHLDEPNPSVI